MTDELAELLGLLVADGWVGRDGQQICFTNNDAALRMRVAQLWSKTFLGTSHEWMGRSGWDEDAEVGKLNLNGGGSVAPWLREQLYTRTGHKQVPPELRQRQIGQRHACRDALLPAFRREPGEPVARAPRRGAREKHPQIVKDIMRAASIASIRHQASYSPG